MEKGSIIVVVPRLDPEEPSHLTLKRGLRELFPREEELPHVAHFPDGAPYFADRPDLLYSSSDCQSSVALQVAPAGLRPAGVDVEDKADQARRVLPRYASEEDCTVLDTFSEEVCPLRLWSAKEAIFKAFSRYIRDFRDDITLVAPGRFRVRRLGEVSVAFCTGARLTALSRSHHPYPDTLILAYITDPATEERLIVL